MPTITSDHTGYRSHNGIGLFNLMNMNCFLLQLGMKYSCGTTK